MGWDGMGWDGMGWGRICKRVGLRDEAERGGEERGREGKGNGNGICVSRVLYGL